MCTEERVRELCAQLLAAKDADAVNEIAPLLRQALHEHCERIRNQVLLAFPPRANKDMAAD
jgi:hypothetical protein